MRKVPTDEEFWQHLASFKQSAFRFEQQPAYDVGVERDMFDEFLAGHPKPPTENPDLWAWMTQVAQLTAEGKTMSRVRIADEPPTDYQRWSRYMDRWNREAGETIDYLSRRHAHEVGLLQSAGSADWWLFDDQTLMLMFFDEQGVRQRLEMSTDEVDLEQAQRWRDLAIRAAREEHEAEATA